MAKRSIWIGAGVIAAIAAVFAVWQAVKLPSVAAAHPVRGPAVEAVYATGTVEPTVMTPIAPRIGARIAELEAFEGYDVKKGQVLARLENKDVQGNLDQLIAQEKFAHADYDRYARLVKGGIIAQATFDKAKSDWQAARAAVDAAKAQAGYMLLTSPGDCRVIQRDGEVGQFIPINQPVFWLSCAAPLRVSSQVDEEDISLVRIGQTVLIRADAFAGQIFHGKVLEITPKGDPVARSYRVRVSIPQDAPLRIGMTAETNIVVHENKNALLIPANAFADGKVWVVRDGRLAQIAVTTGAKGADQVEIRAGLTQNDLVATNPDANFKEGERVHAAVK
jgi:multidrug efflux system membrane fusion protein